MLGHLKPKTCHTNPEHKAQYQEMYCSICASLRRENNLAYSFLLNHELTLVMLALRPHLQEAQSIRTACPAKAYLGRQDAQQHPAVDLAGKFSIVLGWVKATDWATDRPRFYKNWIKNALQKKVNRILPDLPTETQEVIAHYLWLTKTNATDFEEVNHYTGLLSENIVLQVGKATSCPVHHLEEIAQLFNLNGKLVSIADHLIDAEKDLARKEYNPIFHEAQTKQISWTEAYFALHTRYNRLKLEVYEKINALQTAKILSLACTSMLRKAIQNLDGQVSKHTPYFLDLPTEQTIGAYKPSFARADCGSCDCGGCDGCSCEGCGECCGSCPDCVNCCEAGNYCFCSSSSKTASTQEQSEAKTE